MSLEDIITTISLTSRGLRVTRSICQRLMPRLVLLATKHSRSSALRSFRAAKASFATMRLRARTNALVYQPPSLGRMQ